MRPIPRVAECPCGALVIGGEPVPGQRRYWCHTCVAFAEAIIRASTPRVALPPEGTSLFSYLEHVERSLTQQALDRTGGNKNRAAKLLGLNRTTLVEKLKRMGAE
ncbi:MAG: hypothetical protein RL685_5154 [Pseudomonadota bacterium]|jgi:DNA-binding NtrC family response regulator